MCRPSIRATRTYPCLFKYLIQMTSNRTSKKKMVRRRTEITSFNIHAVAHIRRSIAVGHVCANHDTEGKRFKFPIHCCDVTKPPYLFSGELCTSPLHCKLFFVYTVCCRRTGQYFSVLRTRKSDVILTQRTAVVGEVTSPNSDTMCHSCAPVFQNKVFRKYLGLRVTSLQKNGESYRMLRCMHRIFRLMEVRETQFENLCSRIKIL